MFGDDAAWFALAALSGPYLPWGSGAMRPAGLVAVCNDIVLNDRRRVVELGSGVSTVLLARLLTQAVRGGDPVGGCGARRPMGALGRRPAGPRGHRCTTSWSSTRRCCPHAGRRAGLAWYDEAAVGAGLDAALGGDLIDLLLVDGPPAFAAGHGLARYPALPVLRDRLAPGATVVLDDVERPGEQEVLRRWEREFGLVFDRQERADAGVAIAILAD